MPPRASSRLRLILVPAGPGFPPAEVVLGALRSLDWGVAPESARAWSGPERFFANGQGGFGVRCPEGGASVADRFVTALEAWRRGGERALGCACGQVHDLAALDYAPPAAFASTAIELADVGSAELAEPAAAALGAFWPGFRVVGSRG